MLYAKLEQWKATMAARYAGLQVLDFTDQQFIEDHMGHYVALMPIQNSNNGMSTVRQENEQMMLIRNSYYVIWRLPTIDENILRDVIRETYHLGEIKSLTTDIKWFTNKVFNNPDYVPGGNRTFVALEVGIDFKVFLTKNPCECLLKCFL